MVCTRSSKMTYFPSRPQVLWRRVGFHTHIYGHKKVHDQHHVSGMSIFRYKELVKPVDRLFNADLGIPLTELPILLEPEEPSVAGHSLTSRELAFHQIYYTYAHWIRKKNQGTHSCLKLSDSSRQGNCLLLFFFLKHPFLLKGCDGLTSTRQSSFPISLKKSKTE